MASIPGAQFSFSQLKVKNCFQMQWDQKLHQVITCSANTLKMRSRGALSTQRRKQLNQNMSIKAQWSSRAKFGLVSARTHFLYLKFLKNGKITLKQTSANGILKTSPASTSQLLLRLSPLCRVRHTLCESVSRSHSISKWKCLRKQVGYSWQKFTNIWTKSVLLAAIWCPCSEERRCTKPQFHHYCSCQV